MTIRIALDFSMKSSSLCKHKTIAKLSDFTGMLLVRMLEG